MGNKPLHILLYKDRADRESNLNELLKIAHTRFLVVVKDTTYEVEEYLEDHSVDLILVESSYADRKLLNLGEIFVNRFADIPVIMVCASGNDVIARQTIRAGVQDFIVKGTLDEKQLSRAIKFAVLRHSSRYDLEAEAILLKVQQERLIQAQEMASLGNWEMDIVNYQMKWTAQIYKILEILENSTEESLSSYLSFVHPEDRELVSSFFNKAANNGRSQRITHRILVKKRNIKYVSLHATLHKEKRTNNFFLLGSIQDVTERKIKEQLIIEKNISTKTEQIKAQALNEMGFQVRTPLASITNLLYVLEADQLTPNQKKTVNNLLSSADDLNIAVTNLLNFSVMVSDNLTVSKDKVHIRTLLQSIVRTFKLKSDQEKITVSSTVASSIPDSIIADRNKLMQILYNLIDNSIKFNKESGTVHINLDGINPKGNQIDLQITVKDTGRGMKQSLIDEITTDSDLLQQYNTETTIEDKKLGLSIIAKLLENLNGSFNINSSINEGTTVNITIPVVAIHKSIFRKSDKPELPLHILLVEDHFINRFSTQQALQNWSNLVKVDVAEDGVEAIEKFEKNVYDIILMDIDMPRMNGIEATKIIREKSDVPVIALTAHSSQHEQRRCFDAGMNDYLNKPVKPKELQEKIMSLVSMVLN